MPIMIQSTKIFSIVVSFWMLSYYLFGLQIVHKGIGKLKRGDDKKKKRNVRPKHEYLSIFILLCIYVSVWSMKL